VRRRALLAAAAAATTTGIAGCLDDGSGGRTGDAPSATPTATEDGPRVVDQSFEVTRVECGSDHGGHDVTTDDGVVTVEGTLDGSNTCYTAELATGEYDAGEDRLYVEVAAVDDSEEGEACNSCIVEVDYVAEFTFEGGEPSGVHVEQRGAAGGSSSASESVSGSGESTPENGSDTDPTATDA